MYIIYCELPVSVLLLETFLFVPFVVSKNFEGLSMLLAFETSCELIFASLLPYFTVNLEINGLVLFPHFKVFLKLFLKIGIVAA